MVTISSLLSAPNTIIIVAKRGSGKSYLEKWLIYNWSRSSLFGSILVFSNSIKYTDTFDFITDESLKYEKFDEEVVLQAMEYQEEQIKKVGLERTKLMLLVLDDIDMTDVHNSDVLTSVFTRGRHLNIAIVCCIQYPKFLSPCMRSNCDYLMMSNQTGNGCKILKELCVYNEKLRFDKFIDQWTQDYNFLIFNNKTGKKEERWIQIKASKTPKFSYKQKELKKIEKKNKKKS